MRPAGDADRNTERAASAAWMIPPARGWQHKTGRMFWKPLARPMSFFGSILLLLAIVSLLPSAPIHSPVLWRTTLLCLLMLLAAITFVMLLGIQRRLHEPLTHLRGWALRMRGGDLSARITAPASGEFAALAADINRLSDELQALAEDMERKVQNQTTSLAQKNQLLEILYDVASGLNAAHQLDDLLARFLQALTKVMNARAATAYLLTEEGLLRLAASAGIDHEHLAVAPSSSGNRPGRDTLPEVPPNDDPVRITYTLRHALFGNRPMATVVVPLRYHNRILGTYQLFIENPELASREDMRHLFLTVGQQLGMAVEKARLDLESHRLALMQERQMIANELHDSLAQSLASLRIQTTMLDETLQQSGNRQAQNELRQIQKGQDRAHRELRELLLHCRAPMDKRGLLPAIEGVVERFRRDTGISVFVQKQCRAFPIDPGLEIQVLRIVQESLANIRKYSQAHNVRILLHADPEGNCRVLVEDDGLGMVRQETDSLPGERLGLNIMQERARSLGGALSIESEPGEGTRVLLTFNVTPTRIPTPVKSR